MRNLTQVLAIALVIQLAAFSLAHGLPIKSSEFDKPASPSIDDTLYKDALDQYFISPSSEMHKTQESIFDLVRLLRAGSYNSVIENISKLSSEYSDNPEIIGLKAAALVGLEDFDSAKSEYNRLQSKKGASSLSFAIISDMLLKKNNPFEAMQVCQSGLIRNIQSARLLYQMGFAYDMMDRIETSVAYFEGAESANDGPDKINQQAVELAIANAYYKLNKYEKAKNALKSETQNYSDIGIPLIINSKYSASQENYDEAYSFLDSAKHSSRYIEALLTKAQIDILTSKPQDAITLLNAFDTAHIPSHLIDQYTITKALANLTVGEAQKSLSLLENLQNPDSINHLHMLKAIVYFSMNNKNKVVEELKQASLPYSELAAIPNFKSFLDQPEIGPDLGLAYFCLDQKFYRQAAAIADKHLKQSGDNMFFNFILAESYLQMGKHTHAIDSLKKLNRVFEGSHAIKLFLSRAYADAGMTAEAHTIYEDLLEERPDFVVAHLIYANMLSNQGEWSKSIIVYEKALNFVPDSPHLQMGLGWALVHSNEILKLDNLLPTIEKNQKIEKASFLHLKGWATFKRKKYVQAEELLSEAIKTAPGDPEICFHLGMAMMETGNQASAMNLLQQSLLFQTQREKYNHTISRIREKKF